ncbi:MAG: ABC transporter substrate-binding protein [Bacillota bacterium]
MQQRRKRTLWLVVGLMLVSLVVSACGESGKTGTGGNTTTDNNTQTAKEEPKGPRKGGTLTVGRIEDTETLDPHRTTAVSSNQITAMTMDTLVVLDYDMTVKPGLAEKWEISDEGKTYTFFLKKGVKFHSGKAMTAADVKYTLDRWKNLKGSPSAFTIKPISSVEVKDDYTVVVRLSEPFGLLLTNLTASYASILNSEFTEKQGDNYGTTPQTTDGTGPFKVVEWVRNDRLVLERNPDYTWGPAINQNQGPAHVEKIVWKVIPEGATRMAELETGGLHFTADIPAVDVDRLKATPSVKMVQYADFNTVFMGMRTNKKPLDDIRVRRAIQHAINKKEIVDGGFYGLAQVAKTPAAPGIPGHPANADQITYGYDPQKAGQLLDEAGWKMGSNGIREKDGKPLTLELWYSKGSNIDVVIPMVQAQLKKVGIDLKLKQLEWSAYLAALRAGEHQLMWMSIRYTTTDGVLYFYFHSKQRPAPNRFEYVNPTVDDLLDKARITSDAKAQAEMWAKVQEEAMRDAFWTPIVHEDRIVGHAPALEGLKIHPSNVLYKGLDLWLKN